MRYYGATPIGLTVRVEKIKLYPVNRREERIGREEEGGRGTWRYPNHILPASIR
jgi:hypothetical protein